MVVESKVEPGLGELKVETRKAVEPLFHPTNDWVHHWQGGWYFSIFARPSKRIRAILDVEREVLIAGNVYYEQQARSLNYAKAQIDASNGRLEPKVCLVVHCDPKGNSKLKKWGRQQGITVIPIYARNGRMPAGAEFEKALSFELFSQDPFDVTGPVETDAQFFGRRTEAQELARKLQGGQIRAHLGIRKIGKTSIMHRVLKEVRENYECNTIFIDCQTDAIFSLTAAQLVNSIASVMVGFEGATGDVYELVPVVDDVTMEAASQRLGAAAVELQLPCIIAFDEIDYITPGSPTASHWRAQFIDFWRNIRAAYQAASRADRKLSVLVCGVSSKWFSVESIDGIENAALSFIPEEYLNPLPRGASIAMIKNIGTMAGLHFDEGAADAIAAACSDMPFWIRKACSYIHGRTDTAARPLKLGQDDIRPSLNQFVANDGADLAQVALQHLFRVYPELRAPAVQRSADNKAEIPAPSLRTLQKYGLVNQRGEISGQMVREGLAKLVEEPDAESESVETKQGVAKTIKLAPSDWIEEIQIISRRRNVIERKMREVIFNFLRFVAMSSASKTAKDLVLEALQTKRRDELKGYKLEEISERIYWLELINIITKNWVTFEKVFNDQKELKEGAKLVNDRPDAHAKSIDLADVALYRRALGWFEEKLEKL